MCVCVKLSAPGAAPPELEGHECAGPWTVGGGARLRMHTCSACAAAAPARTAATVVTPSEQPVSWGPCCRARSIPLWPLDGAATDTCAPILDCGPTALLRARCSLERYSCEPGVAWGGAGHRTMRDGRCL